MGGFGALALLLAAGGVFLFGIEPTDPMAFGTAAAVLALVLLGSAYLPARKAARADALAVLRAD